MYGLQRMPGRHSRALDRYAAGLGVLVERHLSNAALVAARQEAEREAAETRLAKREVETVVTALRDEMAMRLGTQTRLAHLASHDPLTDLPNRSLFGDRLAAAMAEANDAGRRLALLYVDLDDFKTVNDTFGHAVGDALLRQVSARIDRELRCGEIVARMGGDEFAVLHLAPPDREAARSLGNRIIARLSEPFSIEDRPIFVGASVGISLFPDDAHKVELLHRNADLAMYEAKSTGRNRCCFFDDMLEKEAHRRALLEQALREPGLASQLRLAFQPQVDVRHGGIVGVEALLRWTHPVYGPISPDEFIPIAERSGLSGEIGAWVLRESCRQAKRWHGDGLQPISVAVNVATTQFRDGSMPQLVSEVLAETGLPPAWLELEITETGIMRDMHVAADTLVALHQQGVSLAIDDFGTGYSSLSYLRRLPVDRIKIDRSFVNDVTVSEDAAIVANTIVQLAHSLRLQVVAEGVETAAQADFVRDVGCNFAQGYFYSRPLDPGEIPALVNGGGGLEARA